MVYDLKKGKIVWTFGKKRNYNLEDWVLSANGRYIVFVSSSRMAPDDKNGKSDVFQRNLRTGKTLRVSVGLQGREADGHSQSPSLSADGRYIAFQSNATNLVKNDTNQVADIFVYDRLTRSTIRVSVGSTGGEGNGASSAPAISADGRYVAFASTANDLVPDDLNPGSDVFLHDMATGETLRVSRNDDPKSDEYVSIHHKAPAISSNGRFVAFGSKVQHFPYVPEYPAPWRLSLYDRDTQMETSSRISIVSPDRYDGPKFPDRYAGPVFAQEENLIAFASNDSDLVEGDTNGVSDVFVYRTDTKTITRVSVDYTGADTDQGSDSPSLSADGNLVAFVSSSYILEPTYLVKSTVFVRDLRTGTITSLGQP